MMSVRVYVIQRVGRIVFFTVLLAGLTVVGLTMVPHAVYAQLYGDSIATTQRISDGLPKAGDLVSLDPQTRTFYLTRVASDKNVVGVVASNPVLLLSGTRGGTPVVTSGRTVVNVSTTNGSISTGDYLTTSVIVGVAAKASSTSSYIIGTALSAFPSAVSTTSIATTSTVLGQVQVSLAIGPNPTFESGTVNKISTNATNAATKEATAAGAAIIFRVVKYILAALVTAGTIYVAFRTSNAAMNSSIISIGRNPLAKRSIRSVLLADAAIIVLISVVGLVMAFALVLVPV